MRQICLCIVGSLLFMWSESGFSKEAPKIHLLFSDQECSKVLDTGLLFPARTTEIDAIVRTFLKGPEALQKLPGKDRYSGPDSALRALYLGHRLKNGGLILRFKEAADEFLNGTVCVQHIAKGPLYRMLFKIPGVKGIQFEIGGEIVSEWDA